MKFLASLLLVLGVARYTQGLECYDCTVLEETYNGHPSEICLHPVTTGDTQTASKTCTGTPDTLQYCLTKFLIKDGVVTSATRACAVAGAGSTDHEINSDAIPTVDQCFTNLEQIHADSTAESTCYFPCTGEKCNTKSAVNVLKCATDCTGTNQDGCNYITGNCKCTSGFSGADCATADTTVIRKCSQCNSETDTSCATTATAAVACPADQQYCSTTTTTIHDSDDTPLKTVTVRGCTSTYSTTDECFFSNIFSDSPISDPAVGQQEVTCVSTCDTDGCNTNTANGVVDGTEAAQIHCVICQDTTTACKEAESTSRKLCPSGSTHCKSTVSYLISERNDLTYSGVEPGYILRSIKRECATAAETTGCTQTDFGSVGGVKKVTCTETCQEDGCNVGWPARPNCILCSTGTLDSYDECRKNPPEAKMCPNAYEEYCVVMEHGIQKDIRESIGVEGYPRRIERKCSHIDFGTNCTTVQKLQYSEQNREIELENCNRTCTTDGCNAGSGSSMAIQTMVAVVIPAFLGWLAQTNL